MNKLICLGMLMLGCTSLALASGVPAPEIDAQSGAAALALLGGAITIIRSRKK